MEQVIMFLNDEVEKCYKAKADFLWKDKDHFAHLVSKRIEQFEQAISILEKAGNKNKT